MRSDFLCIAAMMGATSSVECSSAVVCGVFWGIFVEVYKS